MILGKHNFSGTVILPGSRNFPRSQYLRDYEMNTEDPFPLSPEHYAIFQHCSGWHCLLKYFISHSPDSDLRFFMS